MRVFNPEVFQGTLRKKKYFEGWYFKNVSYDKNQVMAFIPGVSLHPGDAHSFVQYINGQTGETHYFKYPLKAFEYQTKKLFVKLGNSIFTKDQMRLDLADEKFKIKGTLDYSELAIFPKSLVRPGIMGWYSFVPFMECYHGIVSANHKISGALQINNKPFDFSNGKGYIEKDWGKSFPESWLWLQSNSFASKEASLFVSIAKIPWLGRFFIGFISFLYLDGKFYLFASYNGSKIKEFKRDGDEIMVCFSSKKHLMNIRIKQKNAGKLIAPSGGNMNRTIKESINSEVGVELKARSGEAIFREESDRAGLEMEEKILSYF